MKDSHAPEGVEQLRYAGGGHPGCGGFIEALEVNAPEETSFIIQEYRHDANHDRVYRWREFDSRAAMLAWFELNCVGPNPEGYSPWSEKPVWESK